MQASQRTASTLRFSNSRKLLSTALAATALTAASGFTNKAHAVDGCIVLLCLAAPSWRAIPQCVPPIRQLFRDLARGKGFPSCAMAGAGYGSSHQWASAPDNCPPQYTRQFDGPNGPVYRCDYSGAIAVHVDGVAWARTWWDFDGGSVTEYSGSAKDKLGSWDRKFDEDYDAWFSTQPAVVPPCPTC